MKKWIWSDHQKWPAADTLSFVIVVTAFFYFVWFGKTISTSAEQMMTYFPWRGAGINFEGVKTGYPQTDFADSFFPHWKFLASELRELRLPLWYPFDFSGTRAPETGLFGFYYPPRILLLFVLGPVHGHSAMMMLHAFLAMTFSFKLLQWLGSTRPSAFMGAIIWAFNGHNIYHLSLEFVMVIAAWLPLALWAAGRAIEERSSRWSMLSGLATGMTWFSGYANYSLAFGLVTTGWWILLIISDLKGSQNGKTHHGIKLLGLVCTAGVTAIMVGAAYWLPFIDVFRTAVRIPATIEDQLKEATGAAKSLRR
jgi:hypothetical protein